MDRLKRIFSQTDVDSILILNSTEPILDPNFFYLSGLTSGRFEGSALIAKSRSLKVVTGALEHATAKKQIKRVVLSRSRDHYWKILKRNLSGKVGLNYSSLPHQLYLKLKKNLPNVKFVDVSEVLEKVRMIKDNEEISRIEKAAEIASETANKIPNMKFKNESELQAEIGYLMAKLGSTRPAFPIIVAGGKNSADPHYMTGCYQFKPGDFVLCDFGATFKNYLSDITRTFFFQKVSLEQQKIYETVQEAQQLAIDAIGPGVKASSIHQIAEKHINSQGYKGRFIHSLGHMLGVGIHEGKKIYKTEEFELEPSMVLTVEPGIYIPELGGVRIEDDVLVTKTGCKLLTTASRSPKII